MRVRFVPDFTDVHACTGGGTDDERLTATATRDEDSEIPHVTEPVGWLLASCEHVPDSTRLDSSVTCVMDPRDLELINELLEGETNLKEVNHVSF